VQTLIDGLRVDARENIGPSFRVPVRVHYGYMEPTGLNANRFAQLSGGPMSLEEDE
jgi:hypothetical protein